MERFQDADELCQAGLRLFPSDVELSFREGFIAHRLGQLERAIDGYRRALAAQGPRHFSSIDRGLRGYKTRHNLALVYEDFRQHSLAEEQWRMMIAEMPSYRFGWYGLVNNLILQSKFDRASRELELMASQSGLAIDGCQLRSQLAKAKGDLRGARQELERGLKAEATNQSLLDQLCKLLFEFGQPEETESRLRELITLDPDHASAWQNLGSTYLRLKQYQAAEEAFRAAIKRRPNSAVSHLYLGFVLEELGDLTAAQACWEKAMHVAPNDPAALEAKARLNRIASQPST